MPAQSLPTEADAMACHTDLINRAIFMHFIREGNTAAATTFMNEARPLYALPAPHFRPNKRPRPSSADERASAAEPEYATDGLLPAQYGDNNPLYNARNDAVPNILKRDSEFGSRRRSYFPQDITKTPHLLQKRFSEMYELIDSVKKFNLDPAIAWARAHSKELDARDSNLEFDLIKLKYIWLFKGPRVNGLPDNYNNGVMGARRYASANFPGLSRRFRDEARQLAGALAYAPNLKQSPYSAIFDTGVTAFEDVAFALMRDFCCLLGLAPQPPLLVATVAGAIALPLLVKYTTRMNVVKTDWLDSNELGFETALPRSLRYHPIFVCPITKTQTTDKNPPMVLPCGHVISNEALNTLCRSGRFKCSYCPVGGLLKEAVRVRF